MQRVLTIVLLRPPLIALFGWYYLRDQSRAIAIGCPSIEFGSSDKSAPAGRRRQPVVLRGPLAAHRVMDGGPKITRDLIVLVLDWSGRTRNRIQDDVLPFRDDRLRGGQRDGGNLPAARRDADILHGQLNQLQRLLSLAMAEPTLSALLLTRRIDDRPETVCLALQSCLHLLGCPTTATGRWNTSCCQFLRHLPQGRARFDQW